MVYDHSPNSTSSRHACVHRTASSILDARRPVTSFRLTHFRYGRLRVWHIPRGDQVVAAGGACPRRGANTRQRLSLLVQHSLNSELEETEPRSGGK